MLLNSLIRLDALSIALLPLLALGVLAAWLQAAKRWWRALLETALAALIMCALDLRLAALSMVLLGWLAGRDRWSRAAGVVQATALLALGSAAQAWQWNDLAVGAAFRSVHVLLLLLGGLLALGLLPLRGAVPQAPRVALALSGLYPLLRMYELGPINWGWTLAAAFAGMGAALWLAITALRPRAAGVRASLLHLAWWGAAFAPVTLATEAGITATWALALSAVLMTLASAANAGQALVLPLVVGWLALWLGSAAALAGGVPLLAAAFWGLTLLVTLNTTWQAAAGRAVARWRSWLVALLSLFLTLAFPRLLLGLLQPVWTQLGAGLTPFGRITLWPWMGLSVRNAGSQTVATLPSLALAGMMLVAAALGYLLMRLWQMRTRPTDLTPDQPRLKTTTLWALIERNLPTARRVPPIEDSPDDI